MTSHWQKIYLFQKSCSNPTDISLQNYTFRNLSSCVTTPCKFRIWMCKQSICKSQPIIPWYNEYHILECPWDTWVHSKFQSSNISCVKYTIYLSSHYSFREPINSLYLFCTSACTSSGQSEIDIIVFRLKSRGVAFWLQ